MLHWSKDFYLNLIRTIATLLTLRAQKNNNKRNTSLPCTFRAIRVPIEVNAIFLTSRKFNPIMEIHLSNCQGFRVFLSLYPHKQQYTVILTL